MANFSELVRNRRTVREFEERSVPHEVIEEILADSCQAPSAANERPWRFIIVHNRALIKRLSDESKGNILSRIEAGTAPTLVRYRKFLKDSEFNVFYNSPCLILVTGLENHRTLSVDCALCVSYIMFSATSRGLGTCWVDLGADIQDPKLLEEIGLPADHRIVAPVIIGYPRKIPKVSDKRHPHIIKVIG